MTSTCVAYQYRGVAGRVRHWLTRNTGVYALILIMAWGLKYHYSHAGAADLLWILAPTAGIVSAVSGMEFEWEADAGYMSLDRRVLIAPACAGINFLIIAFSMASFFIVPRLDCFKIQLLWTGIIEVGAYGFTLLVNAVRIMLSLYLFDADIYHGWLTVTRVHRIEGVVIYFMFLCLFFHVIRYVKGRMPGMVRQVLKTGGLKASVSTSSHRPVGRMERVPPRLIPLLWYAGVMILVPVLNGAYRGDPGRFSEHAITILTAGFVIALVFPGIKGGIKLLTGTFGFRSREHAAAQKNPDLPSVGVFVEQGGDGDERH